MIGLTRLNGRAVVVNAQLIETVESTPDTVVSLTTGKKFVVLESPEEVIDRVISYRRQTSAGAEPCGANAAEPRGALSERPATRAATQHED